LTIEVCFTPKLFADITTKENYIVVLADILRATTSICAAFHNGVKEIIPVASLDEAQAMKEKGFLVASEQDGKKLEWADFGNSAFNFSSDAIGGQALVYCTTNGTRAIEIAKHAEKIAMGAFINISALAGWLFQQNKNIVILCSGWKNKFCLEDALFAGALSEKLLDPGLPEADKESTSPEPVFSTSCDSVFASIDLWNAARHDIFGYLDKAAHRHRLKKLGLDDVIPYSFISDSTDVIPVYSGGVIRNIR